MALLNTFDAKSYYCKLIEKDNSCQCTVRDENKTIGKKYIKKEQTKKKIRNIFLLDLKNLNFFPCVCV